jgi:hypothetical protein
MRDFFNVNELAEYFGVNPKTIYRRLWAKAILNSHPHGKEKYPSWDSQRAPKNQHQEKGLLSF